MFLSDRDLLWAIQTGRLIINPRPEKIDATSIDLHLGKIDDAKIWDIVQFASDQQLCGEAMKSSLDRSGFCFGRLERRLEHQRPMRI